MQKFSFCEGISAGTSLRAKVNTAIPHGAAGITLARAKESFSDVIFAVFNGCVKLSACDWMVMQVVYPCGAIFLLGLMLNFLATFFLGLLCL